MFRKIFENGYSVLPINPNGKNPIIKEWEKYCRELPTEEQVDNWDTQKLNIGVACGPASNLIVIDIDTDDADILNLLPPSPVRRRGKKGEARFFRVPSSVSSSRNIESRSFPFIDILADGRQALIPPSIHPDTKKPYVWLTPDTLENTKAEDLPEFDITLIGKLEELAEKIVKKQSLDAQPFGRNNSLKKIVTAMRARGEDELKIVDEVYNWDTSKHSPRLFTDRKEGFYAENEEKAKINAWEFVSNVTRSLIKSGVARLTDSNVIEITEDENHVLINQYKSKEYPQPEGLIKDVRDLIFEYSEREMPNIALGGAVALMSSVCSNQFRFNQCWSNMYVLNLAPTGTGKSFPMRIISMLLDESLSSNLVGFGNYASSSAFISNLVSRRERLDMIDEIGSLFNQMKNGGTFQATILEEMCKLWSASSGKYNAAQYSDKSGNKSDTSSCFNPCINILGSSTIEGIKPYIDKMMVMKGLIPRFIIFKDEKYGDRSKDVLNVDLFKEVSNKIGLLIDKEKRIRKDIKSPPITGPIYDPIDMSPKDKDSLNAFQSIKDDFFNRIAGDLPATAKDMLTRGKEQTMKLALIHAVGCGHESIQVSDLLWAKETFEVSLHNSSDFIFESAVDSEWEKDVASMLDLFKRNSFVTNPLIGDRKNFKPQRKQELITHLLSCEKIVPAEKKHKGKTIKGWTLI
jgi:hypothetical protein